MYNVNKLTHVQVFWLEPDNLSENEIKLKVMSGYLPIELKEKFLEKYPTTESLSEFRKEDLEKFKKDNGF